MRWLAWTNPGPPSPPSAHRSPALRALLEKHRWNVAAVAREAKMARSHLYTLIQKHGLKRK